MPRSQTQPRKEIASAVDTRVESPLSFAAFGASGLAPRAPGAASCKKGSHLIARPFKLVKTLYVDSRGRQVPKGTPGARKLRKKSKSYYGLVPNPHSGWKRVKLCEDKAASEMMLGELRKRAALQRAGLVDPFEDHRKRPLTEHLADFEAHLERKRTHEGDA